MRLLNIYSLKLEEFTDKDVPEYCILSHRWGKDEVSYKEFRKGSKKDGTGYRKIVDFCAFMRIRREQFRLQWFDKFVFRPAAFVWIDTCKNRRAWLTSSMS